MLERIRQTVIERRLLARVERLLVGVSGGPDSVVLLDALVALQPEFGWQLQVAHFNHRLRGAESDGDEAFVRRLAADYGLPCTTGSGDVRKLATREKLSIEDAARRLRHAFFQETARSLGLLKLALAHTADDQVETLLQRLLRGAGTRGLAAIHPSNRMGNLTIVRPMLDIWKHDVLAYIKQRGLKFREDASNWDPQFQRNRIRHELIPLLARDYNPKVKSLLHQTAEMLAAEDEWLEAEAARALQSCRPQPDVLLVAALLREHVAVQRRVIYRWLLDNHLDEAVDFRTVEALRTMAKQGVQNQLVLTAGVRVSCDGGRIELEKPEDRGQKSKVRTEGAEYSLAVPGVTEIPALGIGVEVRIEPQDGVLRRLRSTHPRFAIHDSRYLDEWLDADAVGASLQLRTWRAGDQFQPIGMRHTKKVQDIFVNEKVPVVQRRKVPLLVAANGEICWVVGHRIGEKFKITTGTRRAYHVRVNWIES